jgi:uncharacterized membrane protein YhaH (DUF805 family)
MIPFCMSLDVGNQDGRRVRLFLPVILLWVIVFVLLIVALPFVFIAALATRRRGPGFALLAFYPVFFTMLFALSGLRVDIASHRSGRVYISFA